MSTPRLPAVPWRAAAAAAGAAALALALVGALALALQARHDVAAAGDRLDRLTDVAARRAAAAPQAAAARLAARTGGAARVIAPDGRVLTAAGVAPLWRRSGPPALSALATAGAGGWRMRAGAVEASSAVAGGGRIVARAPLPPGTGEVTAGTAGAVGAVVLALALGAGVLTGLLMRRRNARLTRRAGALSALAAGRPPQPVEVGRGAWGELDRAAVAVAERAEVLQRAAELGFDGVGAVLGPLATAAAARTPSGGRLRNAALESLLEALAAQDARAVESAVAGALEARGSVSRRLVLSDGRALEVEGWPAAGGRVVAVGERTEQQRLEALRLRLAGSASRQLHAPALEIQAIGRELSSQVSSTAARRLRRLLAAADRLERQVGRLLRGTPHDPRRTPPRVETLGVAGFLWGLAHDWDRSLKRGARRMEVSVAPDLPPVRTDPALVEEILGELVENAARYSPRGGTVRLSATATRDRGLAIDVADSGSGFDAREIPYVREAFFRGEGAQTQPGAGLGLGVAAALAERLGGRLALQPGPGGRARLELPGEPLSADGDAAPSPGQEPVGAAR